MKANRIKFTITYDTAMEMLNNFKTDSVNVRHCYENVNMGSVWGTYKGSMASCYAFSNHHGEITVYKNHCIYKFVYLADLKNQ